MDSRIAVCIVDSWSSTTEAKVLQWSHRMDSTNFIEFQWAYTKNHSTETALLQILDEVLSQQLMTSRLCCWYVGGIRYGRPRDPPSASAARLRNAQLCSYPSGRMQFLKKRKHQLPAVDLQVGIPQGSELGPLLFAAYYTPTADVTTSHSVHYHQYANDTQLHLAMHADNTADRVTVLSAMHVPLMSDSGTCRMVSSSTWTSQRHYSSSSVPQTSRQNPEAGVSSQQCCQYCSVDTKAIWLHTTTASVPLVAGSTVVVVVIKSRSQLEPSRRSTMPRRMACLQRLAGTDPVSLRSSSVRRTRSWPGWRLQSLPSERPDARPTWQCRALCAGDPWVSRAMWPNTDKRCLVRQWITYKLAVLTFNICHTATPAYLSRLITVCICGHTLYFSAIMLSAPSPRLISRDELSNALLLHLELSAKHCDSCSLTRKF